MFAHFITLLLSPVYMHIYTRVLKKKLNVVEKKAAGKTSNFSIYILTFQSLC